MIGYVNEMARWYGDLDRREQDVTSPGTWDSAMLGVVVLQPDGTWLRLRAGNVRAIQLGQEDEHEEIHSLHLVRPVRRISRRRYQVSWESEEPHTVETNVRMSGF